MIELVNSLLESVLFSIILMLFVNFFTYKQEKHKIHNYCEEIVYLSYMLFYGLNEFLTLNGMKTIDNIFDYKNDKYLLELNLDLKERNYTVFELIVKKFSHINKMKYLRLSDLCIVKYEAVSLNDCKDKSFNKNYMDLLKVLRSINTLFKKQNYLQELNRRIKESAESLREKNSHCYSEYVDQCIEKDIAEKESCYARG